MEVIHLLQRSEVVRTTSTLGTETKATIEVIKVITNYVFSTITITTATMSNTGWIHLLVTEYSNPKLRTQPLLIIMLILLM